MLTKKSSSVPVWERGLKAAISLKTADHAQASGTDCQGADEDRIVLWVAQRNPVMGRKIRGSKAGLWWLSDGARIIPVGISGSEKILRPGTWDFFLDQDVRVSIGMPIDASAYTVETRDCLMDDVKEAIRGLVEGGLSEEAALTGPARHTRP